MYEWVFEKGYADFDNQGECEDFIRWAIDEIVKLRKIKDEYENCKGNCTY
jgi:hypothetical protein